MDGKQMRVMDASCLLQQPQGCTKLVSLLMTSQYDVLCMQASYDDMTDFNASATFNAPAQKMSRTTGFQSLSTATALDSAAMTCRGTRCSWNQWGVT
jgi:hypothetical protein